LKKSADCRTTARRGWLDGLAPFDPSRQRFDHVLKAKTTPTPHKKRHNMGRGIVVAIAEGALAFGPWQHVFYLEFDGRYPKRALVKLIGE
jgi:thiamine phosphate synthase YjbQ (UPF0047 family)